MKSDAPSVARDLAEQPADWSPTLKQLRAACRRELRDYTEQMAYGMPSTHATARWRWRSRSRRAHLSLYIAKQGVLDAHRAVLAGLSVGKGCIRYRRPDQIDWDVVTDLLADTRELRSAMLGVRGSSSSSSSWWSWSWSAGRAAARAPGRCRSSSRCTW